MEHDQTDWQQEVERLERENANLKIQLLAATRGWAQAISMLNATHLTGDWNNDGQ